MRSYRKTVVQYYIKTHDIPANFFMFALKYHAIMRAKHLCEEKQLIVKSC